MAKKKAAVKEVERKVLGNGVILVKYDDGSYALITPIQAEDAEEIFGGASEDEDSDEDDDEDDDPDDDEDEDGDDSNDDEDEDEDDDSDGDGEDEDTDDGDEDDDEVTPEQLAEADFEELEDICDDKELETDPDEFDEKDIEKLRAAIAKELGIKLPKASKSKKDTKKKKK